MSYCTKCGKQNLDTAKFCTGCGATLLAKAGMSPSSPSVNYPEAFAEKKKEVATTTWLLAGILLLVAAAGAYFIFFNKKKEKADAVTETPPVDTPQPQADTAIAVEYNITPAISQPVPLSPGNSDNELVMTESEVKTVSQELENFYQCENNNDIGCLLNNYSFPVNRYYQLYNVGYDDLHKLFTESFNEKLSYHHITIKWGSSTLQKTTEGYKAILYADYEFTRANTPDEQRNRSIQIIIFMDTNYKITTIYENQ